MSSVQAVNDEIEGRIGRSSVEEILCDAVNVTFQCGSCAMHACGREDMDVRMLGNGRPFIVKILDSPLKNENMSQILDKVRDYVNKCQGLNSECDVEITHLKMVGEEVWHTMQAIAEEKKKSYRCVVVLLCRCH